MKSICSRRGLSLAAVLLALAALAPSAQAIRITPNNTPVSFHSTNATLTYAGAGIACNDSTLKGTTGVDSPSLTLTVTFAGCSLSGLAVTVTCVGTLTLTATATDPADPGSGSFTIDLNSGFGCTIQIPGVCTIDVSGPQDPGSVLSYTNTTGVLQINVNVSATRTGSSLCGPSAGTLNWSGTYVATPPFSVDP